MSDEPNLKVLFCRCPRDLHAKAKEAAKKRGTDLNTFLREAIASKIACVEILDRNPEEITKP